MFKTELVDFVIFRFPFAIGVVVAGVVVVAVVIIIFVN